MGKGDKRRPTDKAAALSCHDVGHTMPDKWGNCWRCGAKIDESKATAPAGDQLTLGYQATG